MLNRPRLRLDLDDAQRAAAEATDRNLLVIAGPGAGKTRLIIGRIQHLLDQGVPPQEISCITFTNKAAAEIITRIREHFPAEAEEISAKTFHGLAQAILKRFHDAAGLPKHFHIVDETTQNDILAFALKKHALVRDHALIRRLKSHLDLEKGAGRFPLGHPKAKGEGTEAIPQLFTEYQAFLAEHGAIDFNDLLLAALQVLVTSPEAQEALHRQNRHLLLDEFQDVNQVQYELIKLIAGPGSRVLAVADGDQMIYAWRGSNRELMEAYKRDFAAEVRELGHNYRSEEEIQYLSRSVIAHNYPRDAAHVVAVPEELTDRSASVFHLLDEEEEARAVERIIQAALRRDESLGHKDIAVLYRTHDLADRLEKDLALAGIPVQRVRKPQEEHEAGLENLIAYLRLSLHLFDWDLYRAMEYPRKLLSPLENLWLNQEHQRQGSELMSLIEGDLPPWVSPLSQEKLRRFGQLVRELHQGHLEDTPSAFFRHLVDSLGEFRSPFTEDEEALLLKEAAAEVTRVAGTEELQAFVKQHPDGRLLLVHPGTVTGALAGLIVVEAARRFLRMKTALAPADTLTVDSLRRLLGGGKAEPVFALTLGLTPGMADQLEGRIADSGAGCELLHLVPQETREEAFQVAFHAWALMAWFLAQPLEPLAQQGVFLDLETTGIDPYRCQLLEVAAQRVDLATGAVTGDFHSLVRPAERIPSKVVELTGITDTMVAEAPQPAELLPRLLEFIGPLPVVGHNIQSFDLAVVRRMADRLLGQKLTNLPLDTLLWAKELFPRQNHSQEALCDRFGLRPPEDGSHHRANVDVDLNRQLFPHLERADHLKRGMLFSQVATVLLALASFQDEAATDPLRLAVREGAKRILQRSEQDDRDIAMLLGRHFDEFQAARLLSLVKKLKTEPLGDDITQDRFERHVAAISDHMLRYEAAGHTEGIRGFLDFYYLLNDQDYLDTEDTVKMLTVHAAKGLEFQVVIIVGMEQGNFPHYLAVNNIHRIEEERRLLYVALTRARRKVYLTYVQTRGGKYRPPSMFLRELPVQLVRQFKSERTAAQQGPRPVARPERGAA